MWMATPCCSKVQTLPEFILNPLSCVQIWFELYKVPSEKERELITEVIASWFMVGRLGGYNAMNMQVSTDPFDITPS